ncbi:MAG: holB [Acidimicrobiales bacterium]|nr:holB [Acidimicrobiales bacterium]
MTSTAPAPDAWSDVLGQDHALAILRGAVSDPVHAWLFVGPPGSGKRAAARAFAGELLAAGSSGAEAERHRALARAEQHPDLLVVEREGASISAGQAAEVVTRASRSPIEGDRKVLVLDEFHLVQPAAGPKLLKTIEEPPPGTFFIVLAEDVPPDLVTIASRCVRVDFNAVPDALVVQRLQEEGIDAARASEAAAAAMGDLARARLLATDDRLALRVTLWRDVPRRLDGRGATAAALVDEVRATIDDAEAPLRAQQAREAAELTERIERYGQRGSGAKQLEERHRREKRRLRTDELRLGLVTLARAYRDEMTVASDPRPALAALAALQSVAEALLRNPSEELLLQALFLRLPSLP